MLQIVGCSHRRSSVATRERIAFRPDQVPDALAQLQMRFPHTETVLLSTCNRVELYFAAEDPQQEPSHDQIIDFLAQYHGLSANELFDDLFRHTGREAVRHLFAVAASLDSMVVGEAQILSQVKQAYEMATHGASTGPVTHAAFQAAIRFAKRISRETTIHQRRVSIPSVAVCDYGPEIFERYDDKVIVVLGAGEMGEETLRYLVDAGGREISVLNRSLPRAELLAKRFGGHARPWDQLHAALKDADVLIAAAQTERPIITLDDFMAVEAARDQRPLFLLDLAVPRNIDPLMADQLSVYLYTLDDLSRVCETNQKEREKQWPAAETILNEETDRYIAQWYHHATGPIIEQLKLQADEIKDLELTRLLNRIEETDEKTEHEIRRGFDRLVNKLLHPPLESLRDESQHGTPHGLLAALKKLFQLKDG